MSKVNENKRHWKILPRYTFNPDDERGDFDNGKRRKGCINSCGYICHSYLCEDGQFHTITEHIAKYESLVGEVPDGYEIDHIDGNCQNNKLSNLRCVTHMDNILNPKTFKKRIGMFKGERNPNFGKKTSENTKNKISLSKRGVPNLSVSKQVDMVDIETGEIVNSFESATSASKVLGFNKSAIEAASRGKYNRDGNRIYKGHMWYYYG